MKKEITSDEDYIEAYNQGYELSKELGLKPDILEGLSAGNSRLQAMKECMEQYGRELSQEKDIIPPMDLDSLDNTYIDFETPSQEKDKDVDLEL